MNSSQPPFRILLVGGGTGGHFYPLIAIAEELKKDSRASLLYYAGPDKYDPAALDAIHAQFVAVCAGKRRRYTSLLNIIDSLKVLWGSLVALMKLFYIYPDVVVSKGGYTSVPVVLAATFLRIPIVVHESDTMIGRANALAARYARVFITSYDGVTPTNSRAFVTKLGIPIRRALHNPPRPNTIESFGIDPERPVVLVIGGSQGAERINGLILDSLDELLEHYTVIHQTGKAHIETCTLAASTLIPDEERRKHYKPYAFLDEALLNDAYHVASIVISRAGSTSLYEIALHSKPSIIIPISPEVSHDQRTNAYTYARTGAAIVMEESNLTDSLLTAEIARIMRDDAVYERMVAGTQSFANPTAARDIASLILDVAQQH